MKVKKICVALMSFVLFLHTAIAVAESENSKNTEGNQESVKTAKHGGSESAGSALPDAKAGECYAKVIIPAEYKAETQTLTIKEASSKIEVIPAKYEWTEEKILVREASKKLVPVPATYSAASEKVLVTPAERIWVKGNTKNTPKANPSLLSGAVANGLDLANAKIGNCFVEHYIPAQYKTVTQQVLKSDPSHKIEIIPAKYQMVEEKVLVKEASAKLVEVPAVYETVTEKVLVTPATTEWKKGRGPVERLDNSTGEIMCLVEVPAVYKTVDKRVLKTPASTKKIEVPAEYKVQKVSKLAAPAKEKKTEIPATYETVTKRTKVADEKVMWAIKGSKIDGKPTGSTLCLKEVPAVYKTVEQKKVKTPASVKVVEVPAQYKVVKKRKLVSSAKEKKTDIPAKTQVVSRNVKVKEETMQWRPVLCETNMSPELITQIQTALKKAGHNPGGVDGKIGQQTMVAVDEYQRKNGLPRGGLTLQTIEKLGIKI